LTENGRNLAVNLVVKPIINLPAPRPVTTPATRRQIAVRKGMRVTPAQSLYSSATRPDFYQNASRAGPWDAVIAYRRLQRLSRSQSLQTINL